jgi:hypothetical protein
MTSGDLRPSRAIETKKRRAEDIPDERVSQITVYSQPTVADLVFPADKEFQTAGAPLPSIDPDEMN